MGLPVPPGISPPPLNIATAHHPDGDIDPNPARASLATNRKRAAPIEIDVENANQNHLGVYAPDTGRPLAGEAAAGGSSELICLCTKAPKVPRPRNGKRPFLAPPQVAPVVHRPASLQVLGNTLDPLEVAGRFEARPFVTQWLVNGGYNKEG